MAIRVYINLLLIKWLHGFDNFICYKLIVNIRVIWALFRKEKLNEQCKQYLD